MNAPERRKSPRVTDRYRETTNRASRVIDEARLLRLELGAEDPESEVRALRSMLRRQAIRYPQESHESGKARNE